MFRGKLAVSFREDLAHSTCGGVFMKNWLPPKQGLCGDVGWYARLGIRWLTEERQRMSERLGCIL